MNRESSTIDKDKLLETLVAKNPLGTFFGITQEMLDAVWSQITSPDGNSVTYVSMEIGADLDVFNPLKQKLLALDVTGHANPDIDSLVNKFLAGPEKIPNYSGGLGILAGDTLKSYADLKIPVVAVSMMYRKGYFSQLVDSQLGQIAWTKEWSPENTPSLYLLNDPDNPLKPLEVQVPFYDRQDKEILACAQVWLKTEINSSLDYFIPVILLDYSTPSSPEWIRNASQNLYDSSSERTKAIQRRLLGAGISAVMEKLGITSKTIHLNEQHGVVIVLHLIAANLRQKLGSEYPILADDNDILAAAEEVSQQVVYTIHTPVKAGHDRFEKNLYAEIGHSFCQRILHLLAKDDDYPDYFNFTALAMKVNRATNSVSRLHKLVTQRQFPKYAEKITAITNGVHHNTWISDAKAHLYDSFEELGNWREDPSVFAKAAPLIKNEKFRKQFDTAWAADTKKLINYVNRMLIDHRAKMIETWIDPPNFLSHLDEKDAALDPAVYTIGFARRFSTYKRAALIFEDIDTLANILISKNLPVNFIFSGKAHPSDEPGKNVIKVILDTQKNLYEKSHGLAKLVFVPGYDMSIAKMMVAGVHAWLNSPKRPLEASGTSGMKAAMNGVPNLSIMDGWWVEGYHDGLTGWKFGYENPINAEILSEDHSALLYREDSVLFYNIFNEILDTFYNPKLRSAYLDKGIMNIILNCPIFSTHRMAAEYLQRYAVKLPMQIENNLERFASLYISDPDNSTKKPHHVKKKSRSS